MASPQPPASLKLEDLGERYHKTEDVEEWINKEFGAEMEAAAGGPPEVSSELISFIAAQLVDEYIDMAQADEYMEMAEFSPTSMVQAAPFALLVSLEEGLFYEPDLWSFS